MNKKYYPTLDEHLYHEVLDNGLAVYYLPKENFNKVYVSYAVKYGSFDNNFYYDNIKYNMPYGMAHFLEHKMFDMDGYDALVKLSLYGAYSNAFTTYDKTVYQLSTSFNFKESLELFMKFLNTPYFTNEAVEKEKKIIENEIKMYLEYPDEKALKRLYKNMFNNHPITIDIAGNLDSINLVSSQNLYDCYNAFYNPKNMVLFITGNFNLEEARKIINESKININKAEAVKENIEILKNVNKNYDEIKLDIYTPKLYFGILLDSKLSYKNQLTYKFLVTIFIELLFGSSSNNYNRLLKEELINESFYIEDSNFQDLSFICCEAETHYPDKLHKELDKIFKNLDNLVIDNNDFIRIKNCIMGQFIKSFNNLENISNIFINYHFMNEDMFLIPSIIDEIKLKDIYDFIKKIKLENISYLLALPNED